VQADSLTMVTTPDPADEARTVEHRQRTGELRILPEWDGVVIGVTGLDNRPQARPHIQRMKAHAAQTSYSPVDLGRIYRFPQGTDGSGHTIGVVQLGGGIPEGDLDACFATLGIPMPRVDVVEVGNGSDSPGDPADGEVMLDSQVIGALAPGACQVVYFAGGQCRSPGSCGVCPPWPTLSRTGVPARYRPRGSARRAPAPSGSRGRVWPRALRRAGR
jgi:kumamolisin